MVKRGTRRTVGIRGALVLALLLLLAACGSGSTTGTEDTGTSTAATEPPATTAADSTEATGPDDGDTGGDAAEGDRVFKVGALNPQTGPYTQLGVDVNAGFRHYVEEVKGGQLAGWTIEIIEEDTASDVDQSSTKVRKLVEQDEVDFMFGIVHSGVAYGIAPYINESQVRSSSLSPAPTGSPSTTPVTGSSASTTPGPRTRCRWVTTPATSSDTAPR